MFELSKGFLFEAAHTLQTSVCGEGKPLVHGHSYRADVVIRGYPDVSTGMIIDLNTFDEALQDIRNRLDYRFLDDIQDLGPATIENLSSWIWRKLLPFCPNLWCVTVRRDSDMGACSYYGEKP
jgi:6-pyruvoyltetrahydropterin/6-carboxytetrahydropterin synthase